MIKKIVIFVAIVLCSIASAQVDTAWTRRWSSPGAFADYAYIMTADGAGNVYAAGSKSVSSSNSDVQVIKYNTLGDVMWTYVYTSGTSAERASGIAVGPSGNVYVSGYTMGYNAGDYLTIKLNGQTGDSIWTRIYDGPGTGGYDFARRVVVDASENVYVTGYSSGGTGMGTSDFGTVKYDSNGVYQWAARYDGGVAQTDQAYAIFVNDSGVYVTGYSNPSSTGTAYNIVTIKYNRANGNEVWVRSHNGSADGSDYGRDIVSDALGNVYITGASNNVSTGNDITTIKYTSTGDTAWIKTYSNPDTSAGDAGWWIKYDPSGYIYVYGNTTNTMANGQQNLCVVKYDASNGNEIWAKEYNGPNVYEICPDETGQNPIAFDVTGNIYITGSSRHAAPSTQTDFVAVKYNSNGVEQWIARYDYCDSSETVKSIALDNAGNVYVTGISRGLGTYIDWATIKYVQSAASYYSINASAYGPGIIIPSGIILIDTTGLVDTTFTITPNVGAQLDSLIVDGINHGADSTYYTFVNVTANHTIKAYFSLVVGLEENLNHPIKLANIYPNPFKSQTTVHYQLSNSAHLSLKIYNCLGREIRTLVDQHQTSGAYSLNWNGKDNNGRKVGNGLYILRVITDTEASQYRLILVR